MLKSIGISSIKMLLLPTALKGIENLSSVRLVQQISDYQDYQTTTSQFED